MKDKIVPAVGLEPTHKTVQTPMFSMLEHKTIIKFDKLHIA